jgi:predicted metalloprotease with PDZ domain
VTVHVLHESAGTIDLVRHLVRGRDDLAVVAHLPGRSDAAPTTQADLPARSVGIAIDSRGTVTAVTRGSSAERAGIRVGDVLLSVDGTDGAARLAGSGPALLTLARGGERYVARADRGR